MKAFWLLSLYALAVSAVPVERAADTDHVSGENGWYVPQADGSLVWMSTEEGEELLEKIEQMEDLEDLDITTTPVKFYLYTRSNRKTPQKITDSTKSIAASNFNAAYPTRFVIHGWNQNYKSSMNSNIRDAWLSQGDYNIIIVDWARARSVEYATSVVAVPKVGKKVGSMINYLAKIHGMSMDTLEVIGHSLGAHVAGYAGKSTKSRVHVIVGLDPALPLFSYNKPNKRLNANDAYYVESIQTDGGQLGFLKPIGKGAFYPNGGKSQPGCILDVTGACSHARSVAYYAEAVVSDNFPSMRCSNYRDAVKNTCGSTYSGVRMGAMTNAYMAAGDFYVPVRSKQPYGYGN